METEENLKKQIREVFKNDFRIHEGVEGVYEYRGENRVVIADFILAPEEPLITQFNFPNGFFVIETKYFANPTIPDLANLYIQCLTYQNSTFREKKPFAVFHYSNLGYNFNTMEESRVHEALLCTFGRLNIGRVEIEKNDYEMKFHKGDCFFKSRRKSEYSAKTNLLSVSFGSSNNKLKNKFKKL